MIVQEFLVLKDVAKNLLVPNSKLSFDVPQTSLQPKHFGSSNVQMLVPPKLDVDGKIWMTNPEFFKTKRSIFWCAQNGCL